VGRQTIRAGECTSANEGNERSVCWFDVDAAYDKIGTLIGDGSRELCSIGVADEKGWTDAAKEITSVGTHGEFLATGVRRQRDEGRKEGVKNRVAPHAGLQHVSRDFDARRTGEATDAWPLCMKFGLRI